MQAISSAPNPDAATDMSNQLGYGLGKAFQLIFMMIGFFVVGASIVLMAVPGGVQLGIHKKVGFSRVCTILAMIFKLVAAAAMFWNLLLVFEPWVYVFSKILYVFVFGTTVTSFAWSIAALVRRKKIVSQPLKEVHSEEESKPDEMVIYPTEEMPKIEEEEQVVFYPENAE